MSSNDGDLEVSFSSAARYSASVVFLYDYVLTFNSEVRYIWKSKLTFVSILYYLIRYWMLCSAAIIFFSALPAEVFKSQISCTVLEDFQIASGSFTLVGCALFGAMRVYAIFDRNIWLFMLIGGLGLTTPAITGYTYFRFVAVDPAFIAPGTTSCGGTSKVKWTNRQVEWLIAARATALLTDALILILTWIKLAQHRKALLRNLSSSRVSTVLVKDTGIYFGLLSIVNTIGIIVGRLLFYATVMADISTTLTAILSCRLLLDIRELSDSTQVENSLFKMVESALLGVASEEQFKEGEDSVTIISNADFELADISGQTPDHVEPASGDNQPLHTLPAP